MQVLNARKKRRLLVLLQNSALRKKISSKKLRKKGIVGRIKSETNSSRMKSSSKIYAPRLLSGDLKGRKITKKPARGCRKIATN